MNTLYVPLSEIEKLWRLKHTPELMVTDKDWQYIQLSNIYYLPTVDISIVDEMIEEFKRTYKDFDSYTENWKWYHTGYLNALQEIKSRLSPKN